MASGTATGSGLPNVRRGAGQVAAATLLPAPEPVGSPAGERRRDISGLRRTELYAFVGAAFSALGTTWLLFTHLAPFSGRIGFVVLWWALFVGCDALLTSLDENGPTVHDRVAGVVIQSLAVLLLTGLVFVVGYVLARGAAALVHVNFFVTDLADTGPLEPLSSGGVLHAIVGTLEQITISLLVTVPLGITAAVFLNEFPGVFARFVRTIVEAMTALPSIVAGLFVFTTWILAMGMEKSGFAAALALSFMMLPIIVRAADVVIRLVPGSLREASYAMGASRWRTVLFVVLPTARSGLATAVILGTARGIGETSPVLLTAGFAQVTNVDPVHGPQVSLPLLVFELFKIPQDAMRARAFGAGAVLLLLVLGLFVAARSIGGRGPGMLSERQRRHREKQSRQDAERLGAPDTATAPLATGIDLWDLAVQRSDPPSTDAGSSTP